MSYRKLTGFAAVALLLASGTAQAQSTYESNCRYENGARVCESNYRAGGYEANTTTTYSRGRYTSETTRPEVFKNEQIYFDAKAEARRAERLRKSGYRAPGEVASPCLPPTRMTARDGCQ